LIRAGLLLSGAIVCQGAINTKTALSLRLRRFDNAARFYAVGANHHSFRATLHLGSDPLEVGIEAAFIEIVSMTHIVAHHRFFSAYFTSF